ncbi:MAG: hypothetical protein ACKO22_02390 [Cyanobium sp.]
MTCHAGDAADRLGLGQGDGRSDRRNGSRHPADGAASPPQHWRSPAGDPSDAGGGTAEEAKEFLRVLGVQGIRDGRLKGVEGLTLKAIAFGVGIHFVVFVVGLKAVILFLKAILIGVKVIGGISTTNELANALNQATDEFIVGRFRLVVVVKFITVLIKGLAAGGWSLSGIKRQVIHDVCLK